MLCVHLVIQCSPRPGQVVWSVRAGGMDRPSRVQYHTCWFNILQVARRADVLCHPFSLRPHWVYKRTEERGSPPQNTRASVLGLISVLPCKAGAWRGVGGRRYLYCDGRASCTGYCYSRGFASERYCCFSDVPPAC